MCGIIGYIGDKDAIPLLLQGLRKLEYRGYDSAGVCALAQGLHVFKQKGRISVLAETPGLSSVSSTIGIAHTRWATHGEPNQVNAHPHCDTDNEIAIVHNGIIENYHALRELLEKEGVVFRSETDSEVVAHLIKKFYTGKLEDAVIKALKLVEGAFGIAAVHKKEEKIVAARLGSPLVIGVGQGEMFVASDVPAILHHTKKVLYLNDNEIAVLTKEGYCIMNTDGRLVNKDIHEIQWTINQIEKKGYKHFMLKEIFEQPEVLENTIRGRIVDGTRIKLSVDVTGCNRIILTACGTSWHSALLGKYLIEQIAQVPVEVDYASELRYRDPLITREHLVVAISQSGETADTLAALRMAQEKGAKTMGIVNVVGSSIARETDSGMYLHAGPEIGVASTKAFTSQVTALVLFALYLRQQKGMALDPEILAELKLLPVKVSEALRENDRIKSIAELFKDSKNTLYLGRGIHFPVALEGALKLKEISYIHAEGYPAAEMKHGPIALIDENMPVVFVASNDRLVKKVASNIQEVKARGGKIISVIDEPVDEVVSLSDYTIRVPKTIEALSSIVNVIPLQLLAYHIADMKGLDVDKPRNLAKSVTVE